MLLHFQAIHGNKKQIKLKKKKKNQVSVGLVFKAPLEPGGLKDRKRRLKQGKEEETA